MHIDLTLLRQEVAQRREEGCDVTAVEAALAQATQSGKPLAQAELDGLWAQLQAMEHKLGCPYVEPSDLPGIRAQRPQGIRRQRLGLSDDELLDKTYGAWMGRSAGCQLGKAVEGWTRAKIRDYLTLMREYPLADYFPPPPPDAPPQFRPNVGSCRGKFQGMPRDDDMDYTILGLAMLEKYGLDFTTDDVGTMWQLTMPYQCTYTAERVAYRNLVMDLKPPATALVANPYREWIGAQIRADAWGYVTPGLPELGAEFSWRDAALSHVKNGIYGEMFVAAMLSASFSTSDVMRVIEIGLSEIPRKSRLAEAVKDTLACAARFKMWEEAWDDLMKRYGHYHGVHTINNAVFVLLGLLYGKGDFERTICIAVMAGLDTDCNGATAGSIAGVILGAKALPPKWIGPLNDRIKSMVANNTDCAISDLAKRTVAVTRKVLAKEWAV